MRALRSIGLFFAGAAMFLAVGFLCGLRLGGGRAGSEEAEHGREELVKNVAGEQVESSGNTDPAEGGEDASPAPFEGFLDAAALSQFLASDTEYVLKETDVLRGTVVETSVKLPGKYVGMNREAFLTAMEQYASSPPLSERKRGFENLEVLSFSRERVVVQMNYRYVQPGSSFYLALRDHKIVVLLEDRETVYIETEISADVLPQQMQEELIGMVFVENEASLYDILEAYTS